MNLNLPPRHLESHPFFYLTPFEASVIVVTMTYCNDIGIYMHKPAALMELTGHDDSVFQSASSKLIKNHAMMQFDNGMYWFPDFIANNCGTGSKLLRNPVVSSITARIHRNKLPSQLEQAIFTKYPEIKEMCSMISGGKTAREVAEEKRGELDPKKKKPKPMEPTGIVVVNRGTAIPATGNHAQDDDGYPNY
jgi:hypothetical protein